MAARRREGANVMAATTTPRLERGTRAGEASEVGQGQPFGDSTPGKAPLSGTATLRALGRCVAGTCRLLARRRLHQPSEHSNWRLHFADGTSTRVYRET